MQSGAGGGHVAAGHRHHITFEFQGQCADEPQPRLFESGCGWWQQWFVGRDIQLAEQPALCRRAARIVVQQPVDADE